MSSTASKRNSRNALESVPEGYRVVAGKKIDAFVLDELMLKYFEKNEIKTPL
jgi:hypothetical protein